MKTAMRISFFHSCLSAIAYDAVYNELSVSERKKIARGLKRLALDPCLGDWVLEPTRIHSLNSMGHNWWTSCACMGHSGIELAERIARSCGRCPDTQ